MVPALLTSEETKRKTLVTAVMPNHHLHFHNYHILITVALSITSFFLASRSTLQGVATENFLKLQLESHFSWNQIKTKFLITTLHVNARGSPIDCIISINATLLCKFILLLQYVSGGNIVLLTSLTGNDRTGLWSDWLDVQMSWAILCFIIAATDKIFIRNCVESRLISFRDPKCQ